MRERDCVVRNAFLCNGQFASIETKKCESLRACVRDATTAKAGARAAPQGPRPFAQKWREPSGISARKKSESWSRAQRGSPPRRRGAFGGGRGLEHCRKRGGREAKACAREKGFFCPGLGRCSSSKYYKSIGTSSVAQRKLSVPVLRLAVNVAESHGGVVGW